MAEFDAAPDFSLLPEIMWVKILAYLDLPTRNNVAKTCHALNNAFNHPSLWHTVKISLMGTSETFDAPQAGMILPERYIEMIRRFGPYFQNLTIHVSGFVEHFPKQHERLMAGLAEKCRLERLTLQVGVSHSKVVFAPVIPTDQDLSMFIAFIQNAFRLKSFHLKTWPLPRGNKRVAILEALTSNPRLEGLEELLLLCDTAEAGSWVTRNAIVPSPAATLPLVTHFSNLRSLGLRSSMLSEELIEQLFQPRRTPLSKLSILVAFSRDEADCGLPVVSSECWLRLRQRSPELKVELTVVTRVPALDLGFFLKPEIPVSSLGFMAYSRLGEDDLGSIRDKYHRSLTKFVSLVDTEGLDAQLRALVHQSPHLNYLVFHGPLYRGTVVELAAMRGASWQRFDIPARSVRLASPPPGGDTVDDDLVLVTAADGQIQLASLLTYAPEDQLDEQVRQERLELLKSEVSKIIGYKWN